MCVSGRLKVHFDSQRPSGSAGAQTKMRLKSLLSRNALVLKLKAGEVPGAD